MTESETHHGTVAQLTQCRDSLFIMYVELTPGCVMQE